MRYGVLRLGVGGGYNVAGCWWVCGSCGGVAVGFRRCSQLCTTLVVLVLVVFFSGGLCRQICGCICWKGGARDMCYICRGWVTRTGDREHKDRCALAL